MCNSDAVFVLEVGGIVMICKWFCGGIHLIQAYLVGGGGATDVFPAVVITVVFSLHRLALFRLFHQDSLQPPF